jgi:hypothetical protein
MRLSLILRPNPVSSVTRAAAQQMITSQMPPAQETDELCRAVQQMGRSVCMQTHIYTGTALRTERGFSIHSQVRGEDSEQLAGTTASRTGKCQAFKSIASHFACRSRDYCNHRAHGIQTDRPHRTQPKHSSSSGLVDLLGRL